MTQSGIEFTQVTKRYGGPESALVVKGIDFHVHKGTLTTILGPSGCGKTTTLRMIAGLETPSGGQILIDGEDVTHLSPAQRNVSMVFQSYALFPHINVAYVTHDQSEALAVSDQIVVMDQGVIAQAGAPQDLYERPRSVFVAGFMGEAVLFDAQVQADGAVHMGPLRFAPRHSVAAGAVKVAIRPEAWSIRSAGSAHTGEGLDGQVSKTAYLGSFQEVTVQTALGPIFVVSPDTQGTWAAGQSVSLGLTGAGVSVVAA